MNSGATASVLCRRARLYSPLSQDHRSNPFQVSLRIQIPILVGTKIFLMNERVSFFSLLNFFPICHGNFSSPRIKSISGFLTHTTACDKLSQNFPRNCPKKLSLKSFLKMSLKFTLSQKLSNCTVHSKLQILMEITKLLL